MRELHLLRSIWSLSVEVQNPAEYQMFDAMMVNSWAEVLNCSCWSSRLESYRNIELRVVIHIRRCQTNHRSTKLNDGMRYSDTKMISALWRVWIHLRTAWKRRDPKREKEAIYRSAPQRNGKTFLPSEWINVKLPLLCMFQSELSCPTLTAFGTTSKLFLIFFRASRFFSASFSFLVTLFFSQSALNANRPLLSSLFSAVLHITG